jgi:hypothetical protein
VSPAHNQPSRTDTAAATAATAAAAAAAAAGPAPAGQARREPKAPLEWTELDLNRSLVANGLPDRRGSYEDAGLPGDEAVPVLHVYWNDDLSAA